MTETEEQRQLLPTRLVCRRYGVSDRTIARWGRDPELGFPPPIKINHRKYYDSAELTAFDRANVVRS